MSDLDRLSDDELRALIVAATADRPSLRAVHDAAAGLVEVDAEVLPEVDRPAVIGQGVTEPGFVEGGLAPGSVAPGGVADRGFTDGGVPTFDSVRERITGRAGTAAGQRELDSPTLEEQVAARDEAGRRKLEEIRRSMK